MDNQQEGFLVSIPFSDILKIQEEVRNAIWLYIALTDWVTAEFDNAGTRMGAVLGGAKLSDSFLSDRLGNAVPRRRIRRWRERLIRAGLIVQHRISWGYQIAVVGTRKFPNKELSLAPDWMGDRPQTVTRDRPKTVKVIDRKRSITLTENGQNILDLTDRPNRKTVTGAHGEKPAAAPSPVRFAFQGQTLKITERQDKALSEAFSWADRPSEYRKADSWLVGNPERRIRKFAAFAHNWFSRIEKPVEAEAKPSRPPFSTPSSGPRFVPAICPKCKRLVSTYALSGKPQCLACNIVLDRQALPRLA